MKPDGTTEAWLNDDVSTLRSVGQIKFSEKLDRANHRFADVNGTSLVFRLILQVYSQFMS